MIKKLAAVTIKPMMEDNDNKKLENPTIPFKPILNDPKNGL